MDLNIPGLDEAIIRAMTHSIEESLSQELELRAIIERAGFNDPKRPVIECYAALVEAYLALYASVSL